MNRCFISIPCHAPQNQFDQQRDLTFLVNDLEAGLYSLNTLVSLGERLLQIRFIDQHSCLQLPVELIDGSSFSNPIHQLSEVWQQLLTQPTTSQRVDNWRRHEVIDPLMTIQNKRIGLLEDKLDKMLYLLESTRQQMREGPKKTHLLGHYQTIIDRCNGSLANATAKRYI